MAVGAIVKYAIGDDSRSGAKSSSVQRLDDTKTPEHDISTKTLEEVRQKLCKIVGEENVSTQDPDLKSHAGSEWSTHPTLPGDVPSLIVRPYDTEEVSKVMKLCHERKVPVTAYSGGTSLEGHFAATLDGICIDFSRMDKILTLHKADLDIVVQPAVGWEYLNEELAQDGLFFPPDPGPGAMIGGMIGTGCSGTNAYRYGTMKDWVLNVTVVLADGTIVKTRQRPRKSSAGYDLTRLFIGSEGTLGLVTEATLKVTPLATNTSVAVCAFPTIREAAQCVSMVAAASVPVAAVEILDDVQMRFINEAGSTSHTWEESPTLFFKFAGTATAVGEQIKTVRKLAEQQGNALSFRFATNGEENDELWQARKQALWSVMAKKEHETDCVWTTDVAVPISRLAEIIDETKSAIVSQGIEGSIVGHVGDGNFHAILLYKKHQSGVVSDLVHRMVDRAIEMEGTSTGEHGVGLVKRDYLTKEIGENGVDLMRKVRSPNAAHDYWPKTDKPLAAPHIDKAIIRPALPTELRQDYSHAAPTARIA